MTKGKIAVVVVLAILVVAFIWLDLGRYLSLEYLKARQADIDAFYRENPVMVLAGYFVAYVAITGLSLPGAAIMTLAGGAVFGLLWGTVVVSFASTLGATVAFVVSRYILRDGIQRRYGDRLRTINAGVERDGGFYLFTMRLVPAFPFFVINLVMGAHPDANLHLRLGEPGRDAPGNGRVRERRHAARAHRVAAGNPVAHPHRVLRAAGRLSASCQVGRRRGAGTTPGPAWRGDVNRVPAFALGARPAMIP